MIGRQKNLTPVTGKMAVIIKKSAKRIIESRTEQTVTPEQKDTGLLSVKLNF